MVSNTSEIPFLKMMFAEAAPYVDQIVVTEFDRTHSGLHKDFIFSSHEQEFKSEFPQLVYLQGTNLDGVILAAETPDEHHHNETLMRGWFAKQLRFRSNDVIVSTDADEVLYEETYRWLRSDFNRTTKGYRFRLHQFFYRPNFLWIDKEFIAPVALRYGAFSSTYPNNWRYQGAKLPGFWGVHFSWCIPVDEMVKKVKNYSHAAEHRHLSAREIFLSAREEMVFPFDDRDFRLSQISLDSPILPQSFFKYSHTLDPDVFPEGSKE
jgi:hypothetical protein